MSLHRNNFNTLLVKSLTNHGINLADVVSDIIAHDRQLLQAVDSIDENYYEWIEVIEILQAVLSIICEPQLLEEIAKDICLTLLCKLQWSSNFQIGNDIGMRLYHDTSKVLIACSWHPSSKDTLPIELLQCIVDSISHYISDIQGKLMLEKWKGIEITTAIGLIDSMVSYQGNEEEAIRSSLTNWNDKIITCIVECLQYGDNEIIEKLAFKILPKLCKLQQDNLVTLAKIWMHIKYLYQTEVESEVVKESIALSLICSLADFYLTPYSESTILSKDEFWQIMQTGLICYNSLTRKRAIYLMRYALDVLEKEKISINVDQSGLYRISSIMNHFRLYKHEQCTHKFL